MKKMEKKRILSTSLLVIILGISMTIGLAKATSWSEVARWSDSGFPDPKQFTTEHFNCSHVEWRIRWSYIAVGSPFESVLVIKIYEEGESEYIGLIYKEGYISKSGVKSIHNNSGTFYLGITFANMDECTIIVEQDTDSVPEFTSTALIITLITVSALTVALSKKFKLLKGGKADAGKSHKA